MTITINNFHAHYDLSKPSITSSQTRKKLMLSIKQLLTPNLLQILNLF